MPPIFGVWYRSEEIAPLVYLELLHNWFLWEKYYDELVYKDIFIFKCHKVCCILCVCYKCHKCGTKCDIFFFFGEVAGIDVEAILLIFIT